MIGRFRELMAVTEDFSCLLADHPRYTYSVTDSIRSVGARAQKVCGPAYTVRTRGVDLSAVFTSLEEAPPGSVLVIDAQANQSAAFTGERVCLRAAERGLVGIIIDGCCRDVEGITRLGFPVYARGSHPAPAPRTGTGMVDVPVVCGGAVVQPGDLVAADASGIVVAPAGGLEELYAAITSAADSGAGTPYQ